MGAFFVPLYGINYKEAIKMSERTLEALRNSLEGKIHIYLRDEKTAVEFRKASETKYQYSIDGIDMGKINSSALNKILKQVEKVSNGEAIS